MLCSAGYAGTARESWGPDKRKGPLPVSHLLLDADDGFPERAIAWVTVGSWYTTPTVRRFGLDDDTAESPSSSFLDSESF